MLPLRYREIPVKLPPDVRLIWAMSFLQLARLPEIGGGRGDDPVVGAILPGNICKAIDPEDCPAR